MAFYHTALSRLCKYSDYQDIINFRMKIFDLMLGLSTVKEIKPHSKKLTKYLINFDYISFTKVLKQIIIDKDLVPIAWELFGEPLFENTLSTIDDMFSYVPYQLSGYYGLYDSCVGIDDLENMSEPERIMAMLFMAQEFNFEENSYDNQKNIEYLEQITDKTVQQKMIEIRKSGEDLSKVYKYFCQDYKNEQYKKDKFTESFLYLFERIMRDTGCGFIDMLPEESANTYSGWDELPYAIEIWRDYKEKEKRHSKFIKELNSNKKLNKRFYQFLFEEVIARYR